MAPRTFARIGQLGFAIQLFLAVVQAAPAALGFVAALCSSLANPDQVDNIEPCRIAMHAKKAKWAAKIGRIGRCYCHLVARMCL